MWPWAQLGSGSGRGSVKGDVRPGNCSECTWAEAPHGGAWAAWSTIPTAQAWEHSAPGTQPRIRHLPGDRQKPGRLRIARTLLPPRGPELGRSEAPAPRASRLLQTESSIAYYVGAYSRDLELAASTVIVPPGTSKDKQPPLSLTVAWTDKEVKHLSLSPAPGRGLSSSSKC